MSSTIGFLVDNGPGCDGDVAADFEGALVAHADASARDVLAEMLEPLRQTGAAALRRKADDLGVAGREVRRRDGVENLVQHERCAAFFRIRHLRGIEQRVNPARVDEVGASQVVEPGQGAPLGTGESGVGRCRLGRGLTRSVAGKQATPQGEVLSVVTLLNVSQAFRLACQSAQQILQHEGGVGEAVEQVAQQLLG